MQPLRNLVLALSICASLLAVSAEIQIPQSEEGPVVVVRPAGNHHHKLQHEHYMHELEHELEHEEHRHHHHHEGKLEHHPLNGHKHGWNHRLPDRVKQLEHELEALNRIVFDMEHFFSGFSHAMGEERHRMKKLGGGHRHHRPPHHHHHEEHHEEREPEFTKEDAKNRPE